MWNIGLANDSNALQCLGCHPFESYTLILLDWMGTTNDDHIAPQNACFANETVFFSRKMNDIRAKCTVDTFTQFHTVSRHDSTITKRCYLIHLLCASIANLVSAQWHILDMSFYHITMSFILHKLLCITSAIIMCFV